MATPADLACKWFGHEWLIWRQRLGLESSTYDWSDIYCAGCGELGRARRRRNGEVEWEWCNWTEQSELRTEPIGYLRRRPSDV